MKEIDDLISGMYSPTVLEIAVLVRIIRIRIGVLATPVTVRIYYDARHSEPYIFELSAAMKTADDDEERRSDGRALTESDALRQAVRLLTQEYDAAVRQGKMPDDTWLVAVSR